MNNPNAVADESILAAIETAIDEGDTDIGGGAPPPAIAARLPIAASTVSKRLRDLEAEDKVEQVWGLGGPMGAPRRSYRAMRQDKD